MQRVRVPQGIPSPGHRVSIGQATGIKAPGRRLADGCPGIASGAARPGRLKDLALQLCWNLARFCISVDLCQFGRRLVQATVQDEGQEQGLLSNLQGS